MRLFFFLVGRSFIQYEKVSLSKFHKNWLRALLYIWTKYRVYRRYKRSAVRSGWTEKSFTLSRVFQSSCFATRLIIGRSRSVFKPRFTRFMIIPNESFKAAELQQTTFLVEVALNVHKMLKPSRNLFKCNCFAKYIKYSMIF